MLRYVWDHCSSGISEETWVPAYDIFSEDFLIADWRHLVLKMLQVYIPRGSTKCFTFERVFFSVYACFFLLQTNCWSISIKRTGFVSLPHRKDSPNHCGLFTLVWTYWSRLFSSFLNLQKQHNGLVVVYILEFMYGALQHFVYILLCKLNPECLLPPGWWGLLNACLFRNLVVVTDST